MPGGTIGAALESPWLERGAVALSLASVVVLALVGMVALPLSVDGGWYSYPAFAWSLGRDPFSSQVGIELAQRFDGLAAVFAFETTSSVRLFYAAAWFRVFGGDLLSLRILSLVELLVAAWLAYLLFRTVFRDRSLALLTTALLLTDKTLVLGAATDFRPDTALLAGGCALFVVLYRSRGEIGHTLLAALIGAWVAGIALTAAIPLTAVFVALGVRSLRAPEHRRARLVQVTIVGVVALVAFAWRQDFFVWLLDPSVPIADPVAADSRIVGLHEGGARAVLAKEASRFWDYFWVSNLPLLLAVMFLAGLLTVRDPEGRRVPPSFVAPLLGLAGGLLVLALLDPHRASQHMMSLIPFALLAAAKIERLPARWPRVAFAALVALSALASIAVGARQIAAVARHGGGNEWREDALEALFTDPTEHLVLGPVELWPQLPQDREIVVADLTRNPGHLHELDVQWDEIDYVILNQDYGAPAWIRSLEAQTGQAPCRVIDRPPHLVVVTPSACASPVRSEADPAAELQ